MMQATFSNIGEAVNHAKSNGGWIFQGDKKNNVTWYNARYYTPTKIMREAKGSGKLGTYSNFSREA